MVGIFHNTQFFYYEITKLKPFHNTLRRILKPDDPQEKYFRRKNQVKTSLHWGQRKLLLSEIEFLTKYVKSGEIYNIVYAGAAPGTHIKILTNMFPGNKFILVDPAKFAIVSSQHIKVINELFTNELSTKYSVMHNLLFISDIRSGSECDHVDQDMKSQKIWVEIMNPIACMLKFRLPWPLENEDDNSQHTIKYLDGSIYLPVFGPQTTTETRLICHRPYSTTTYNYKKYESQLFYFNVVTRNQHYLHKINNKHLDHCFDCASEIHILREYLIQLKEEASNKHISKLSDYISSYLGGRYSTLTSYWIKKYKINIAKCTINNKRPSIYE